MLGRNTEKNTERIGNIILDYKHYTGVDLYCDGEIEDELLEIVKHNTQEQYLAIIEEKSNWETLYHLSPLRENIVDWLPINKSMKVLEVGSGCGAITGALARKAKMVTCIELSKKRSLINAYRHKEKGNITIEVGNFKDIEQELAVNYDYIILIGVFEYGQGYMGTDSPYEDFMAILKKHLKPEGKMIIAIENKFGLKYWAGCKEDHLGTYFTGIEDYPKGGGVRTFTRNGLEKILAKNGMEDYSFYYPYPDYKFMTSIYSDSYLPKVGELTTNLRNFDRERMLLFDEKNAYDNIIREELFPLYSNSYLVVIGGELDEKFSKFSNERRDKFAIRTDIKWDINDEVYVEKVAMSEASQDHISSIKTSCSALEKRYDGSELFINTCEKTENGVAFEFLQGQTLEEKFDEFLDKDDIEGFLRLLKEYMNKIDYNQNDITVTDYDLIFSNIIMNADGWHIIDYEWTFYRKMETKDIAYRAFYCYTLGSEKRNKIDRALILGAIGITHEEVVAAEKEEMEFQEYVLGKTTPMGVMRDRIGHGIMELDVIKQDNIGKGNTNKIQIYPNYGQGFSEETSYFIKEMNIQNSESSTVVLSIEDTVQSLRIDPLMEPCIVMLEEVKWNGITESVLEKDIVTNGVLIQEGTYAFATSDPNITWKLDEVNKKSTNILEVVMNITKVSSQLATRLQTKRGLQGCYQELKIKLKGQSMK